MDPVSLIVAALVAGASSGLKDTAGAAVRDAYAGLKVLLRRHVGASAAGAVPQQVENGITALELDQQADTADLRAALEQSGADGDQALVRAAAEFLERADAAGAVAGKYHVSISGGKGIVVGNEGTVSMTFNDGD